MIYLMGSLRNHTIPDVAKALRKYGHMVFDSWYAAGPQADDYWQAYEIERGHGYKEALDGLAAKHVFEFDKQWLDYCDTGVLVMPAGKSAYSELGYMAGQKKRTYVLMDGQPERYDVMLKLYTDVMFSLEELISALEQ